MMVYLVNNLGFTPHGHGYTPHKCHPKQLVVGAIHQWLCLQEVSSFLSELLLLTNQDGTEISWRVFLPLETQAEAAELEIPLVRDYGPGLQPEQLRRLLLSKEEQIDALKAVDHFLKSRSQSESGLFNLSDQVSSVQKCAQLLVLYGLKSFQLIISIH